mmetsp:Transcript_66942/g.160315  ORF Transcript_66942/g.160315 Transcript_66942/m.160315 type:complete len:174 (+) Transcript_66942:76-597(+)
MSCHPSSVRCRPSSSNQQLSGLLPQAPPAWSEDDLAADFDGNDLGVALRSATVLGRRCGKKLFPEKFLTLLGKSEPTTGCRQGVKLFPTAPLSRSVVGQVVCDLDVVPPGDDHSFMFEGAAGRPSWREGPKRGPRPTATMRRLKQQFQSRGQQASCRLYALSQQTPAQRKSRW